MHIERLDHFVLTGTDVEAIGPITSGYLRDPDGNLIEIGVYDGRAPR